MKIVVCRSAGDKCLINASLLMMQRNPGMMLADPVARSRNTRKKMKKGGENEGKNLGKKCQGKSKIGLNFHRRPSFLQWQQNSNKKERGIH